MCVQQCTSPHYNNKSEVLIGRGLVKQLMVHPRIGARHSY